MLVRSLTVLVVRMTKRENQAPNNSWTSDFSSFNSFTLASGDEISITIDGIGTLTNPVA